MDQCLICLNYTEANDEGKVKLEKGYREHIKSKEEDYVSKIEGKKGQKQTKHSYLQHLTCKKYCRYLSQMQNLNITPESYVYTN